MTNHDRRVQALAFVLAALAGYVDASGFVASGGFFVSFMSGNSTLTGVGLADDARSGALAGGLIGAFVLGVIVGSMAGRASEHWRPVIVLGLVATLLAGSAALSMVGATPFAIAVMAVAMGAENNVFERNGEVSIGVTYMTGSLVKLGQRIAAALTGTRRSGWVPNLLLWLSFVAGVTGGAAAYAHVGLLGLWGAAFVAAVLAPVALVVMREPSSSLGRFS